MEEKTIFEKIIAGQVPCFKVYEDEFVLAFLSKGQKTRGHTLVIPKVHSRNILDIKEEDLLKVILVVQKVAQHLYKVLNAKGVTIQQNNESQGGQEVFHTHFHIIPRYQNNSSAHEKEVEASDKDLNSLSREIYLK